MSVGPRAKKFNIVSNDNGHTHKCDFVVSYREYKFGPKYQNCQLKLKLGAQSNLNMQNSMVVFTFSVLEQKHLFLGKFSPKNRNCQIQLKFGIQNQCHNILRVSMFCQIFLSPQMKQRAIISYKHCIHELPHELPNDLLKAQNLRKLGNIRRVSKPHRMIAQCLVPLPK